MISVSRKELRPSLSLKSLPVLIFLVFFFGLLLAELYSSSLLGKQSVFIKATLINTLFSLAVIYYLRKPIFSRPQFHFFFPSLLLVFLISLAFLFSTAQGVAVVFPDDIEFYLMVFWIPVCEEILFRVGFGHFFRMRAGTFWGGYFSALLFAYVHSLPSFFGVWKGDLSVPLGPFLLAICCEYLYERSGSIIPAIAFHMICNFTGILFYQEGWLYSLTRFMSILYQ